MPKMISKVAHIYDGRALSAGDPFDADQQYVATLIAIGRAELAPSIRAAIPNARYGRSGSRRAPETQIQHETQGGLTMRIFGFELARRPPAVVEKAETLSAISSSGGGWLGLIRESFAGAWQRNIEVDAPREVLAFSAVFACTTVIASDIGKTANQARR